MNVVRSMFVALVLGGLVAGSAQAGGEYDEAAWREYRAAKRQQITEVNSIWFAWCRRQAVSQTYISLADRYAQMDLSKCSPALRRHIKKAERVWTEVGELMVGAAATPDVSKLEVAAGPNGVKVENEKEMPSEPLLRILELMRTISEAEQALMKDLNLDE